MPDNYKLDSRSATLLFFVLQQAERTVTTGIHDRWPEVREYYSGERGLLIEQLATAMRLEPPAGVDPTRMRWLTRARTGLVADVDFWFHRWRSSHRQQCELRYDQRRFIVFVLDRLLERLEVVAPLQWDTVQLRDDLKSCITILTEEIAAIPRNAYSIENLGYPPWVEHFTLDELVPNWREAAILTEPPLVCCLFIWPGN
jgi:hypothetical protein